MNELAKISHDPRPTQPGVSHGANPVAAHKTSRLAARAFCLTLLCSAGVQAQSEEVAPPQLEVPDGKITGTYDGDSAVFRGIPFAAPPVGPNRFRGPQPVVSWQEEGEEEIPLEAVDFKPGCQTSRVAPLFPPFTRDEDCLYLNVTTSRTHAASEKRPVIVWIHGGAWEFGAGNQDLTVTAEYGGATVVSINHRKGIFGFTWLEELNRTEDSGDEPQGNYAMRDTLQALQWVQDNIAFFGGDPQNVTVLGQSAGANTVCNLIASPLAKGLFHKAIMQSGSCLSVTQEEAQADGENFLDNLGCKPAPSQFSDDEEDARAQYVRDCMQEKSLLEIRLAVIGSELDASFAFSPTTVIDGSGDDDGAFLPAHPLTWIERNRHNDVPVIIGNNREEGLGLFPFPDLGLITDVGWLSAWHDAIDWLVPDDNHHAVNVGLLKDHYSRENFGSHQKALGELEQDVVFRCANRRVATALTEWDGENVYLYEFGYPGTDRTADHDEELKFLFERSDTSDPYFEEIQENMLDRWMRFARDGSPNKCFLWFCKDKWRAFDATVPVYNFGTLEQTLDAEHVGCAVLRDAGFDEAAGRFGDRSITHYLGRVPATLVGL